MKDRAHDPAADLALEANAISRLVGEVVPSAAKGGYIKSVTLSSTMGPGVSIDPNSYRKVTV
jgi:large subunit ribosomal protein L1